MKTALAEVIIGISLCIFIIWYICAKTNYWWASLLFLVVVTTSAIISYRHKAKEVK